MNTMNIEGTNIPTITLPCLYSVNKRYTEYDKSFPLGVTREQWADEHVVWLENIVNGLLYCWHTKDFVSEFGIASWLRHLSSFLEARHDVDDGTRKLLIEILYNVMVLSDVADVVVATAGSLFTKLLRKKRNVEFDIELPWQPLALLLQRCLAGKMLENHIGLNTGLSSVLLSAVMEARKYFPLNSTKEILEAFRPLLCPVDTAIHRGVALLTTMLPVHKYVERAAACCPEDPKRYQYIPEVMAMWDWASHDTVEAYILKLLATLAKNNVGQIDWTLYLPRLFTLLLSYFRLKLSPEDAVMPSTHRIGTTSDSTSEFVLPGGVGWEGVIPAIANLLVFSLTPDNKNEWFNHVQHLVACMQPYVHPSDHSNQTFMILMFVSSLSGCWLNRTVSELGWNIDDKKEACINNIKSSLRGVITETVDDMSDEDDEDNDGEQQEGEDDIHEGERSGGKTRYPKYLYLTKEDHVKFVTMLLPTIKHGMFSKSFPVRRQCYTAIAFLCTIMPNIVMPQLLRVIIPALSTVTMSHQVGPALSVLMITIRHLYSAHYGWPVGIRLLMPLLSLSLPGLDVNDSFKTIQTLTMYQVFVNGMCIFASAPEERVVVSNDGPLPEFRIGSRTVSVLDPGHRPSHLPFFKVANGYYDPHSNTVNATPELTNTSKNSGVSIPDRAELLLWCDEGLAMPLEVGWNWGSLSNGSIAAEEGGDDDVSYAMKPIDAQEWINQAYDLMPEIAAWTEEVVVKCWQLVTNITLKKDVQAKDSNPLSGLGKSGFANTKSTPDPIGLVVRSFINRLSFSICDVKLRVRLCERVLDLALDTPQDGCWKYAAWLCGALVGTCSASMDVFYKPLIARVKLIIHDNDMNSMQNTDVSFRTLVWYLKVLACACRTGYVLDAYHESLLAILDATLVCPVKSVYKTAGKLLRALLAMAADSPPRYTGNVTRELSKDPNFAAISVLYWGRNACFGDARSGYDAMNPKHVLLGVSLLQRYLFPSFVRMQQAIQSKKQIDMITSMYIIRNCIRGSGSLIAYTRDDVTQHVSYGSGWSKSHDNVRSLQVSYPEDGQHAMPNVFVKISTAMDFAVAVQPENERQNFFNTIINMRAQVADGLAVIGNQLLNCDFEASKPLKLWAKSVGRYIHYYALLESKIRGHRAIASVDMQLLARRRVVPMSSVVFRIGINTLRRFQYGSMAKYFVGPITTLSDLIWRACLHPYSQVRARAQDVLAKISYRFRCEKYFLYKCISVISSPSSKEYELTGAMYVASTIPIGMYIRRNVGAYYDYMKCIMTAYHITSDTQVARLVTLPGIANTEVLELHLAMPNSEKFNGFTDHNNLHSFGTKSSILHLLPMECFNRAPEFNEFIGLNLTNAKMLQPQSADNYLVECFNDAVTFVRNERVTVVKIIEDVLSLLKTDMHWKMQLIGLSSLERIINAIKFGRYIQVLDESLMSKLLGYLLDLLICDITPMRQLVVPMLLTVLDWSKPERPRTVVHNVNGSYRSDKMQIHMHDGVYLPGDGKMRTPQQVEQFVSKIQGVTLSTAPLLTCTDTPRMLYAESGAIREDRIRPDVWPLPTSSTEWANVMFTDRNAFGYFETPQKFFAYTAEPVVDSRLTNAARTVLLSKIDQAYLERLLSMPRDTNDMKHSDSNAMLFKSMAKIGGLTFYKTVHPTIVKLLTQPSSDEHNAEIVFISVCEALGGCYRGSKHWMFEDSLEFNNMVLPVLHNMLVSISGQNRVDVYYAMMHFITYDRDMRRMAWLLGMLATVMSDQESTFDMYKSIAALSPMITEGSWRFPTLRSLIIEQSKRHLETPFTKLRESYGHLMGHYLSSGLVPQRYPGGALKSGVPSANYGAVKDLVEFVDLQLTKIEKDEESKLQEAERMDDNETQSHEEDPATLFRKSVLSFLLVLFLRAPNHHMSEVFVKFLPHILRMSRPTAMREKNLRLALRAVIVCGARIPYDRWLINDITNICIAGARSSIWHERKTLLLFLQHFLYSQSIGAPFVTDVDRTPSPACTPACTSAFSGPFDKPVFLGPCYNLVLDMMCDSNIEIRIMAMETLAGITRSAASATATAIRQNVLERADIAAIVCHAMRHSGSAMSDDSRERFWSSKNGTSTPSVNHRSTVAEFTKHYGPLLSGTSIDVLLQRMNCKSINDVICTATSVIICHAGVLGLCSIVLASPRDIPGYLPAVLMRLTAHLDDPAPLPVSVRRALKEFWHTHQDEWEQHKRCFSEDQVELLSGLFVAPVHFV